MNRHDQSVEMMQDLYLRVGNTNAFADYWFQKRWVCWGANKIPYTPSTNTLTRASSTNPEQWGTLQDAFATLFAHPDKLSGIGLVLDGDGLVCIDLDKCVDEIGNITPEALAVLERFRNTYAEFSPSGRGIHIWLRTTKPLPADGKRTNGIEIYQSKRYITITGNRLHNHPDQITDCTDQLHQLYRDLWGEENTTVGAMDDDERFELTDIDKSQPHFTTIDSDEVDDDELIEAFCAEPDNKILWDGGKLAHHPSPSEADCALAYRLLWWTGGDTQRAQRLFGQSKRTLRDKLQKRADLIDRAIQAAHNHYKARTYAITFSAGINTTNTDWDMSKPFPCPYPIDTEQYAAAVCAHCLHDRIIYLPDDDVWMVYNQDTGVWMRCKEQSHVYQMAHDIIYAHYNAIAHTGGQHAETAAKMAHKVCQYNTMTRIVNLMEQNAGLYGNATLFDTDPLMIPLQNGVWDVKQGKLLPHSPDHYITHTLNASYNPNATGVAWERALDNWCWSDDLAMPNSELREYLLHALGYTLTGSVREQKLFILYGPGANGKSTLLTVMQHILGKYATTLLQDVLTVDKSQSREQARLLAPAKHKRLAVHPELSANTPLDRERIKLIVSSEAIPMRLLYREVEMVKPTYKLWVCTNHIPELQDQALWRRIVIIPFLSVFDETIHTLYRREAPDRDLLPKLIGEADYIATQLCHYATRWYQNGLPDCPTVQQFTREQQQNSDPFEEWFASCVIVSPNDRVPNDDAYNHYKEFVRDYDTQPLSMKSWGIRMNQKGVKAARLRDNITRKRYRLGIRLQ